MAASYKGLWLWCVADVSCLLDPWMGEEPLLVIVDPFHLEFLHVFLGWAVCAALCWHQFLLTTALKLFQGKAWQILFPFNPVMGHTLPGFAQTRAFDEWSFPLCDISITFPMAVSPRSCLLLFPPLVVAPVVPIWAGMHGGQSSSVPCPFQPALYAETIVGPEPTPFHKRFGLHVRTCLAAAAWQSWCSANMHEFRS